MIAALGLPFVSAGLNRKWRGEGQAPRWVWYTYMVICGWCVTLNWKFTLIWISFLLGYALLPWQAMFSAVNGQAPSRKDHWSVQWMQNVAHWVHREWWPTTDCTNLDPEYWCEFGIIYGAIRALSMMVSVGLFTWYAHSFAPLAGLLFSAMGYVYYLGGSLSRYWLKNNAIGVPIAEIFMGWAILSYMLVCAGSL